VLKRHILKSLGVSFVSVIVSVFASVLAMQLVNGEIDAIGIVLPLTIPALVSYPISNFFFRQKDALLETLTALEEAHQQLEVMHAEAEKMANLDLMTGILNRHSFLEQFRTMRRQSDKGALLVIDVDHFKNVNDTYGHQKGDEALIAIVASFNKIMRENDILGRLGGEEFGVFLSNVTPRQAQQFAERIRKGVEDIEFEPEPGLFYVLTISIGVVMARGDKTIADLMCIADKRMYAAKNTGRNRVVTNDTGTIKKPKKNNQEFAA
jgi:diguanylate cyclase (GGDEF)-like protein